MWKYNELLMSLWKENKIDEHYFFFNGSTAPWGPRPPHYQGFTITLRHTTLGRTPLDEWSARRIDLYLTTHNTHNRQTSMPPVFFFACPGFFPFDPFLYCLNPFVLHVTLRSMLPSLQQTQHKHPCPRWDFFFFTNSWVFPFDPFLFCINPFSSFPVT
jgi:hypothetical protein